MRPFQEEWALSVKEHFRNRFVSLIKTAGEYLQDSGQYEKAVEYYEKTLETDSLDEEFYRRVMLCYQKLGKNAKAVWVYNRCCSALSANLGIEPSEKTDEIHSIIMQEK